MKRATELDREKTHGERRGSREYLNSLIIALQTHDSVGNQPQGKRLHHLAGVEFQMAAAPLFWLYPAIPMMFMGEEFAAESPFMFFADFLEQKLRRNVNRGRRKEYPHHDWSHSIQPSNERAFFDCKLKLPESDDHVLAWYRKLIALRKTWQQQGLLCPENLSVACDVEKGIFGFNYQLGDENVFVASSLSNVHASSKGEEVNLVDGEIVLDSRQNRVLEAVGGKLQLQPNHAIVGRGRLEF